MQPRKPYQTQRPWPTPTLDSLSPRHQAFVRHFARDPHVARAGRAAGLEARAAYLVLARPKVRQALQELAGPMLAEVEASAKRTIQELARLAYLDPATLHGPDGKLLPIHLMPPHARAALTGHDVVRVNLVSGDGHTEELHKVRYQGKAEALGMLARHFKLLDETITLEAGGELLALLDAGRQRVAAMKAAREGRALPADASSVKEASKGDG